ncbi:MAG: CcmD family protein [Bryobacteraceae bacterium]|jgi:CcmD family protein
MLAPLLAQVSPQDISLEIERIHRNWEFMWRGLIAAWIVLAVYVVMMVGRQRKLRREIERLRLMIQK